MQNVCSYYEFIGFHRPHSEHPPPNQMRKLLYLSMYPCTKDISGDRLQIPDKIKHENFELRSL